MKFIKQNPSRLATYLTAGIGAGCLAGQADAAITVTIYGPGTKNPSTTPAAPAGINVGFAYTAERPGIIDNVASAAAAFSYVTGYFTQGNDLGTVHNYSSGNYLIGVEAVFGATLGSDKNYANISFNGPDDVYEAVAQFYLDGAGGGYLVAIARNDDNTALSISAGKAAIDAVPEPSGLALLALGAGGLLARRRRQVA
ncbi:MAG: PEP-CTERM sorting domain-containing protein [Verrucomicrobiaceae bacterium]|nr:MAG: PEP-CTERM sorting domain-containing protein [Verrucomicrobiaceae bacterium]